MKFEIVGKALKPGSFPDGYHARINIMAALEACDGKVFGRGGAAEMLDVKPTTLASRIKTLGIRFERGAPEQRV